MSNIKEMRIRRVNYMNRNELLRELKELGWYNDYKDYSNEAIRDKLIRRIEYYGGF